MTTGTTGQLGLALPVQGELSGTWGNTVNNGITEYTNIAIAATLTLTNDGAVTLANTTGDASATNIVSSLTGAGTVTAQFAIIKVTGTLTTPKIITAPSYSKTYLVVNAATGSTVSFIRSGQTPAISIAVGESAYVYYNGTDYVKVAGTAAVSSFTAGTTGFTPSTATTGAVTLAGTLATTNGGTNLTSFTSGGAVYATSTSVLTTGTLPNTAGGTGQSSAFTQYGIPYASSTTVLATTAAGTTGQVLTATTGSAPTWATPTAQSYPGAGIANSTGSAWGTSYSTTGSGTVVALNNTPTLTNPTITNYVETPYSANSSTAITLALTNGTVQIITLTGNATITMPTAVSGKSFTLLLKQDATGSRTVTWSTVSWPGGTAPTITSTASKLDKYVFISDGTSWFGSTAGQNYT
jgi:hypothetical protein